MGILIELLFFILITGCPIMRVINNSVPIYTDSKLCYSNFMYF